MEAIRPWISLTRLAEAKAKRKTHFRVTALSVAVSRGSYAEELRCRRTRDRSHFGTTDLAWGISLLKALNKDEISTEVERSKPEDRRTVASADL